MSTSAQNIRQSLFRLQQNKVFELSVIFIIVFSALITGAKTYEVNPHINTVIYWLDTFITVFFLFEITIRLVAEPKTSDFFKKGWNLFDLTIVMASLIPLSGNDTVLLARLLRIFRVLRLVSVIPELRVLINSLIKALPRMGYIALLMFIIFYIYAAIGSFMFENINPELWSNIAIAMLTLFRVSTFEDWTDVMYETMDVYPLSWIFYLSFIFLTAFVFLNMMIGVVLDVMQREQASYAQQEDDTTTTISADELAALHQKIDYLTQLINENNTARVSVTPDKLLR